MKSTPHLNSRATLNFVIFYYIMSYYTTYDTTKNNANEFLTDILSRKEFNNFNPSFDKDVKSIFGFTDEIFKLAVPGIQFFGSQHFIKNFMNPNTPFKRLLLKWQVGTGKSKAIGAIAHVFIAQYKLRASLGDIVPQVFVIAFTQDILQDELLKDPYFGFASPAEIIEWNLLKIAAGRAGSGTPEMQKYSTFLGLLRRRITDRQRGGYYTFNGYKTFVNRLFLLTTEGERIKFNVLKHVVKSGINSEEPSSYTDAINEAVKNKYITINTELLNSMRNTLLICDEIHNVYNIVDSNHYGIAIQYVLDTLGNEAPRCVFMSATPITGSASEVCDVLNLLTPRDELKKYLNTPYLTRKDLFTKYTYEETDGESEIPFTVSALKPNALEIIQKLTIGKVSFLLDANVQNYPQRLLVGDVIPSVPYFKLTMCPFNPAQEQCFISERAIDPANIKSDTASLAPNAYPLQDIVFPNDSTETPFIYSSTDVVPILLKTSDEWKATAGVIVEKQAPYGHIITGPFLHASKLDTYSPKYKKMLDILFDHVTGDVGKVMIYHNLVKISGVLIIQEILRMNGILSEHEPPTEHTICNVCTRTKSEHKHEGKNYNMNELYTKKPADHSFVPMRFVIVNYAIDKNTMNTSLAKFNSSNNAYGQEFRILVGSKIIREGFDLKAICLQIILTLPINFPTTIQVMGRAIRRNSHVDLPEEYRKCKIHMLCSARANSAMTPELKKIIDKGKEYLVIQEIDRVMSEYAIDAHFNYEKIKHVQELDGGLTILPYKPFDVQASLSDKQYTFDAYQFSEYEISTLITIIKILFRARCIWSYKDLVDAINSHKVAGINYDKFDITNINIALLSCKKEFQIYGSENRYKIVYLGASSASSASNLTSHYYYLCCNDYIDIDCFLKLRADFPVVKINLSDYAKSTFGSRNFELRLKEAEEYDPIELILTDFNSTFHHQLLELIVTGKYKNEKLIKLYKRFKAIIYKSDKPIGYVTNAHVNIYEKSTWQNYPLVEYNIGKRLKENNIIIGIVSNSLDESVLSPAVFKLRPPSHTLNTGSDFRAAIRGTACKSYSRDIIQESIKSLHRVGGASNDIDYTRACNDTDAIDISHALVSSFEATKRGEESTYDLCVQIKISLLRMEENARKSSMSDSLRYVYLAI